MLFHNNLEYDETLHNFILRIVQENFVEQQHFAAQVIITWQNQA